MNKIKQNAMRNTAVFVQALFISLLIVSTSLAQGNESIIIDQPAQYSPVQVLKGKLRITYDKIKDFDRTINAQSPEALEDDAQTLSIMSLADSGYAYEAIAIEPLAGYEISRCLGINNSGKVVGRFYNYNTETEKAEDRQAFIWDSINGAQILPTLDGESSAWGINDNGLVSGFSYNEDANEHAVRWDSTNFSIVDIGTLTNTTTGVSGATSTSYNLNNLGQVVGLADIPNDAGDFTPFHAFFYQDSTIQDLGTLTTDWPGWQNGYSIAYDINNNGEIVGIAHDSSWVFLPFIYDESDAPDAMRELSRDPAYLSGEWYAVAINEFGLIGGHVISATNESRPYYWENESASPTPITMPAGFPYGEIYGINEAGQMVGIMWDSTDDNATEHAFIFDTTNGIRDLNDLIDPASEWILNFARDINNASQIVGYGSLNDVNRGFILTPTECCPGDFDGDGDVDGSDLAAFAGEFGVCTSGCNFDFEPDGDVDTFDLAVFASNLGKT
jgi:probable HAF family extracellular repeat protein